MVSNLLSDSEPMKWSLRSKASALLSLILTFKDLYKVEKNRLSSEAKTRVLEIVSLLQIASSAGLVSEMNFSIIRQEFLNLLDFLSNAENAETDNNPNRISRSFFEVPKNFLSDKNQVNSDRENDHYIKDISNSPSGTGIVFKRNNRQNIILGLLKKKGKMTVKDIAQTIKDCSAKTIQRELNALIKAKVIDKTGQRRWTLYFVN
jgi:hypothetical protein